MTDMTIAKLKKKDEIVVTSCHNLKVLNLKQIKISPLKSPPVERDADFYILVWPRDPSVPNY